MKTLIKYELKRILTVAYLISAFVVTAATSKKPDQGYTDASAVKNYVVSSNCANSITSAAIQTGGDTIVAALDPSMVYYDVAPNFRYFGMPVEKMVIGTAVVAGAGNTAYTCAVLQQYPQTTATGTNRMTTVYQCQMSSSDQCQVTFQELPPGNLDQAVQQ
jgi:hypothetical protein